MMCTLMMIPTCLFFRTMIMYITIIRYSSTNHINRHTNLYMMSITFIKFRLNRYRNSSNNRYFLHNRCRYRYISINLLFLKDWFLNMMYILLLIVFLYYRLCNSFFTWNFYNLCFSNSIHFTI